MEKALWMLVAFMGLFVVLRYMLFGPPARLPRDILSEVLFYSACPTAERLALLMHQACCGAATSDSSELNSSEPPKKRALQVVSLGVLPSSDPLLTQVRIEVREHKARQGAQGFVFMVAKVDAADAYKVCVRGAAPRLRAMPREESEVVVQVLDTILSGALVAARDLRWTKTGTEC